MLEQKQGCALYKVVVRGGLVRLPVDIYRLALQVSGPIRREPQGVHPYDFCGAESRGPVPGMVQGGAGHRAGHRQGSALPPLAGCATSPR